MAISAWLENFFVKGRIFDIFSLDARGVTNAFGYDVAGQQVAVTNGFSTAIPMVMTYGYDANGNRTLTTDALGHSTTNIYDALNRVTTNRLPDNTRMVMVYDAVGRKTAQTDQATNTTHFGYDALGRLTSVTNALNKVTSYNYDEAGNQTNQVDALNHATTFEYDSLGRRTKRTLPGTQFETFGYDANGNLLSHTDFNGLTLTNQYDVMNRLLLKKQGAAQLETNLYDAVGQMINRSDTSGTYTWVYDQRSRLRTNTTPVGILYYQYDTNGNLTNLASATSGGVAIGYQYDPLNRLTNVIDNGLTGTKNTAYTYDTVGNLQTLKYPNGVTNFYQYDSLNRLTNLAWAKNGTAMANFNYTLLPAGQRNSLYETVNGTTELFIWGYDNTYRLTSEELTGGPPLKVLNYTYDDVGNRTIRTGIPQQDTHKHSWTKPGRACGMSSNYLGRWKRLFLPRKIRY